MDGAAGSDAVDGGSGSRGLLARSASRLAPLSRVDSERTHDLGTQHMYHARRNTGVAGKRARPATAPAAEPAARTDEGEHALHSVLAGAASGLVSALFVAPLDVVKARRQIQSVSPGADGSPRYRGTLSSLRLIFELEGVRGLFRGLPPTLLGYVPSWSVYFLL
jgi:hypothetical protein